MPTREVKDANSVTRNQKIIQEKVVPPSQYQLATIPQLKSQLKETSFDRTLQGQELRANDSYFLVTVKAGIPLLNFRCKNALFKTILKDELISRNITYDQYRKGITKDLDIEKLYELCSIDPQSSIRIHESDFSDFKLDILKEISSYRLGDEDNATNVNQICPKYYSIGPESIETFENYFNNEFCYSLRARMKQKRKLYGAEKNVEKLDEPFFDTRLSLDEIFDKSRYRLEKSYQEDHFEESIEESC